MTRAAHTILVLLLSFGPLSVSAQVPADYFPASVGNSWQFMSDEGEFVTARVRSTAVINDTNYVVIDIPFARADTIRVDGSGLVWQRDSGIEYLLFDFVSTEVSIYDPPPAWNAKKILLGRDVTLDVPFGTFTSCIVFDIDRAVDFGDYSFAFAPGVGFVQLMDSTGLTYGLTAAVIDGLGLANEEVPVARERSLSISVFPNPTDGWTNVTISGNKATVTPEVTVFDALGRRTLLVGSAADGFDTTDWAPGVYVVRATTTDKSGLTRTGATTFVRVR